MTAPPQDAQLSQIAMGIGELKTQVAVVDTKLTTALGQIEDHEKRIRDVTDIANVLKAAELPSRVAALEKLGWRWLLAGGSVGGGTIAGWLTHYLH